MLDSRSTSEHSKPCYPYAIVPYFFTKKFYRPGIYCSTGRTMSADFICGIRYTRDNAANFVSSMITRSQRLFRARSLFIWHGIMCPFQQPQFEFAVWTFVYRGDPFKVIVPKVMAKIGIKFRSTVCYLIRSKLISRISGGKKCKKWMLQYLFLIIIFFEFSEKVRIFYPFSNIIYLSYQT